MQSDKINGITPLCGRSETVCNRITSFYIARRPGDNSSGLFACGDFECETTITPL